MEEIIVNMNIESTNEINTNNIEHIKEKSFNTIKNLFEKYTNINNDYILQRLDYHINISLSNTLDNELKNYEKRIDRANMLLNEQQVFIQVFLSKNQYYYLPNNSTFYEYNGKHYSIIKEDDILHKLLSTISKERILMDWKYKTKINIIKQIKERNLFKSIPETYTIQNVLNLFYPSIFETKSYAKYFLTIIGDNILKKKNNNIFIVNNYSKKLLTEIDNIAYITLGYSIINNFVTKYSDSNTLDSYRLIKFNENVSIDLFKEKLKNVSLDILCVAAHYSNRYENAESYIMKTSDEIKKYVLYLKNNTFEDIMNNFYSKCINEISGNNDQNLMMNYCINWKNLHFIWKQYLSELKLPNIIYSYNLKNILKTKYSYDEETDTFKGITSKYLPLISNFIKFWESTIIEDNDYDNDDGLEIDEIYNLFKDHYKMSINESEIIKILKHFFPNIEIINDKYILNVKSTLLNKEEDIKQSLILIKTKLKLKTQKEVGDIISFDRFYSNYCSYCKSFPSNKYISSKHYFEKYLWKNLNEFIVFDKFIRYDWLNV